MQEISINILVLESVFLSFIYLILFINIFDKYLNLFRVIWLTCKRGLELKMLAIPLIVVLKMPPLIYVFGQSPFFMFLCIYYSFVDIGRREKNLIVLSLIFSLRSLVRRDSYSSILTNTKCFWIKYLHC